MLLLPEDSICSSELASRDKKLKELGDNYSTEHKLRVKTEKQKDKLTTKLVANRIPCVCIIM